MSRRFSNASRSSSFGKTKDEDYQRRNKDEKKKRMKAEEKFEKLMAEAEQLEREESEKIRNVGAEIKNFAETLKKSHRSKNGATDQSTAVVEEEPVAKRVRMETEATRESAPPNDPKDVDSGATAPPSFAAAYSGLASEQMRSSAIRKAAMELNRQTDQLFAPTTPMSPQEQDDDLKKKESKVAAPMAQMGQDGQADQQEMVHDMLAVIPPSFSDCIAMMKQRLVADPSLIEIYRDPHYGRRTCLWNPDKDQNAPQKRKNVPTAFFIFQSYYTIEHPKEDASAIWNATEKYNVIWENIKTILQTEQNMQLGL